MPLSDLQKVAFVSYIFFVVFKTSHLKIAQLHPDLSKNEKFSCFISSCDIKGYEMQ